MPHPPHRPQALNVCPFPVLLACLLFLLSARALHPDPAPHSANEASCAQNSPSSLPPPPGTSLGDTQKSHHQREEKISVKEHLPGSLGIKNQIYESYLSANMLFLKISLSGKRYQVNNEFHASLKLCEWCSLNIPLTFH